MSGHVLDRPVWSALSTRQATFALGGERARRFAPDIGPLSGARDDSPDSLAELAALVPAGGTLLLLQADAIVLPAQCRAVMTADGVQMVARSLARAALTPSDRHVEALGPAEVPEMLSLAALTRPGPFAARTPSLGTFVGIKEDGVLVAMAGERMRQDGFTEVSGVCTHPSARGRGLARLLSTVIAARILERGETPYLHAYATNTSAISLYESLGFALRCGVHVASIATGNEREEE